MSRLDVRKTYKLYLGGKFPRSESGRVFPVEAPDGAVIARVAQGSRKDLRDAVRFARGAFGGWAQCSGYNRGQILYRIAEVLEDRADTFVDQLHLVGVSGTRARREVEQSVDRVVWYAGWADKYAQVAGNLNPVSGPFFNISAPESTGVVGIVAPANAPLLGLVSRLAPALTPGNTAVVVAADSQPMVAISLAEVLVASDVPPGVVNILTGFSAELVPWLAGHMDVDVIDLAGAPPGMAAAAAEAGAENVKRVIVGPGHDADWSSPERQSPYLIARYTETKTVWHPKGL